eukprot:TRINITY_DN30894_c0_g1_i2.p1 TRINITY_DN30894_c0_g1~~TRINITY_DN30894_c0_g1_i2.p1  ORF type:complete len:3837 (-),score=1261.56 TRINITY_DN30894_c0_g1_i2:66-11576(-)
MVPVVLAFACAAGIVLLSVICSVAAALVWPVLLGRPAPWPCRRLLQASGIDGASLSLRLCAALEGRGLVASRKAEAADVAAFAASSAIEEGTAAAAVVAASRFGPGGSFAVGPEGQILRQVATCEPPVKGQDSAGLLPKLLGGNCPGDALVKPRRRRPGRNTDVYMTPFGPAEAHGVLYPERPVLRCGTPSDPSPLQVRIDVTPEARSAVSSSCSRPCSRVSSRPGDCLALQRGPRLLHREALLCAAPGGASPSASPSGSRGASPEGSEEGSRQGDRRPSSSSASGSSGRGPGNLPAGRHEDEADMGTRQLLFAPLLRTRRWAIKVEVPHMAVLGLSFKRPSGAASSSSSSASAAAVAGAGRHVVEVCTVEPNSVAALWNTANPELAVRPGDKLLEVSGECDSYRAWEAAQQLALPCLSAAGEIVELVLAREAPPEQTVLALQLNQEEERQEPAEVASLLALEFAIDSAVYGQVATAEKQEACCSALRKSLARLLRVPKSLLEVRLDSLCRSITPLSLLGNRAGRASPDERPPVVFCAVHVEGNGSSDCHALEARMQKQQGALRGAVHGALKQVVAMGGVSGAAVVGRPHLWFHQQQLSSQAELAAAGTLAGMRRPVSSLWPRPLDLGGAERREVTLSRPSGGESFGFKLGGLESGEKVVVSVTPGGLSDCDLLVNDIVTHINGEDVAVVEDISKLLGGVLDVTLAIARFADFDEITRKVLAERSRGSLEAGYAAIEAGLRRVHTPMSQARPAVEYAELLSIALGDSALEDALKGRQLEEVQAALLQAGSRPVSQGSVSFGALVDAVSRPGSPEVDAASEQGGLTGRRAHTPPSLYPGGKVPRSKGSSRRGQRRGSRGSSSVREGSIGYQELLGVALGQVGIHNAIAARQAAELRIRTPGQAQEAPPDGAQALTPRDSRISFRALVHAVTPSSSLADCGFSDAHPESDGLDHLRLAALVVEADENIIDELPDWQPGDIVYYAAANERLTTGETVAYGERGQVLQAPVQDDEYIIVRFSKYEGPVHMDLLSDDALPREFTGGWRVGDAVYYSAATEMLESGEQVIYGERGTVAGPTPGEEDHLAVQFSNYFGPVHLEFLSTERPEEEMPGDFKLGDVVFYRGKTEALATGERVVQGEKGEVVGPAPGEPDHINVWFMEYQGPVHLSLLRMATDRDLAAEAEAADSEGAAAALPGLLASEPPNEAKEMNRRQRAEDMTSAEKRAKDVAKWREEISARRALEERRWKVKEALWQQEEEVTRSREKQARVDFEARAQLILSRVQGQLGGMPLTPSDASASLSEAKHLEDAAVMSARELKDGDMVYYAAATETLGNGDRVVYGHGGTVMGLSLDEEGNKEKGFVIVEFEEYTGPVEVKLLSRELPPVELIGGWRVGDIAYYGAATEALLDDEFVDYGAPGEITGPLPGEADHLCIKFPAYHGPVHVDLLMRKQPSELLVGGFYARDIIYYIGDTELLPNGETLFFGERGEVKGPVPMERDWLHVHFKNYNGPVHIDLIARERPAEAEATEELPPLEEISLPKQVLPLQPAMIAEEPASYAPTEDSEEAKGPPQAAEEQLEVAMNFSIKNIDFGALSLSQKGEIENSVVSQMSNSTGLPPDCIHVFLRGGSVVVDVRLLPPGGDREMAKAMQQHMVGDAGHTIVGNILEEVSVIPGIEDVKEDPDEDFTVTAPAVRVVSQPVREPFQPQNRAVSSEASAARQMSVGYETSQEMPPSSGGQMADDEASDGSAGASLRADTWEAKAPPPPPKTLPASAAEELPETSKAAKATPQHPAQGSPVSSPEETPRSARTASRPGSVASSRISAGAGATPGVAAMALRSRPSSSLPGSRPQSSRDASKNAEALRQEAAAEEARLKALKEEEAKQEQERQAREAEEAAARQRKAEKDAEAIRLKAERLARESKEKAEREAEKKRLKEAQEAEAARIKAQREAEIARLQAEREADETRLKAEREAEEARLKAEQEAEEARIKAEEEARQREAEEARLKAEKEAEEARQAALKREAEEREAMQKAEEEKRAFDQAFEEKLRKDAAEALKAAVKTRKDRGMEMELAVEDTEQLRWAIDEVVTRGADVEAELLEEARGLLNSELETLADRQQMEASENLARSLRICERLVAGKNSKSDPEQEVRSPSKMPSKQNVHKRIDKAFKELEFALAEAKKHGVPAAKIRRARNFYDEERTHAAEALLKEARGNFEKKAITRSVLFWGETADFWHDEPELNGVLKLAFTAWSKSSRVLIKELGYAFQRATEAGMLDTHKALLDATRRMRNKEERKEEARDALETAETLEEVEDALLMGEYAGLDDFEIEVARAFVEFEQAKERALDLLQSVMLKRQKMGYLEDDNLELLAHALEECAKASCDPKDHQEATAALANDRRRAAQLQCDEALQFRDIEDLRAAVEAAERTNVLAEKIEAVKTVLAEELRKEAAREQLREASQGVPVSIPDLEAAVQESVDAGLPHDETVAAKQLLAAEKRKKACRECLDEVILLGDDGLNEIEHAIVDGADAGLTEEELQDAKKHFAKVTAQFEARAALKEAMAMMLADPLKSAIADGEAAGLPEEELAEPRRVWAAEDRKNNARDALKKAAKSKGTDGIEEMKRAIEEGEAVGFGEALLEECRHRIAEEEEKLVALAALQEAVVKREVQGLTAAIDRGENLGLDNTALEEAREILLQEQKRLALIGLEEALKTFDIATLKAAIQRGKAAGLNRKELQSCTRMLVAEEKKVPAKNKLAEAVRSRDLDDIETALEEAKAVNCRADELEEAERVLLEVKRTLLATQRLQDAVRERWPIDPLRAALEEALAAGRVPEETIRKGRVAVAEEERRVRARAGMTASCEAMERAWAQEEEAAEKGHGAWVVLCKGGIKARAEADVASKAFVDRLEQGAKLAQVERPVVLGREGMMLHFKKLSGSGPEEGWVTAKASSGNDMVKFEIDVEAAGFRPSTEEDEEARAVPLREAIEEGEASGLEDPELQVARRTFAKAAVRFWSVDMMQCAVLQGEKGGLRYFDMGDLKRKLSDKERTTAAKQQFAEALESRRKEDLEAAIKEAQSLMKRGNTTFSVGDIAEAQRALEATTLMSATNKFFSTAGGTDIPEDELQVAVEQAHVDPFGIKIDELQEAIVNAQRAGLEPEKLETASLAVTAERFMGTARKDLQHAKFTRKKVELMTAIEGGEEAGLHHWEMKHASKVLTAERKKEARKRLKEAARSRDELQLAAAIAEGEALGLMFWELEDARLTLLEEEKKKEARKFLEEAKEINEYDVLAEALDVGENALLPVEELEDLRAFCEREDMKSECREVIAKACDKRDPAAIEAAILEGEELDLDNDDLVEARRLLKYLMRQAAAREQLSEAEFEADRIFQVYPLRAALQEADDAEIAGEKMVEDIRSRVKKEDDRDVARERLKNAVKAASKKKFFYDKGETPQTVRRANIEELEAALQDSTEVGLDLADDNLKAAKKTLVSELKVEAIDILLEASASKDMARMLSALARAEACKVPSDAEEVLSTRTALQNERKKEAARKRLRAASDKTPTDSSDADAIEELKEAIKEGEVAGLDAKAQAQREEVYEGELSSSLPAELDLSTARHVLQVQMQLVEAEQFLAKAVREEKIELLVEAIAQAEKAGMPHSGLTKPRECLMRQRQLLAHKNMKKAIYLKQEVLLVAAIQEAERCNLRPEHTEDARTALAVEKRRAAARKDIANAESLHDTSLLSAAIRAAEELHLNEKELIEARWSLKEEITKQKNVTMAKAALSTAMGTGTVEDLKQAIRLAEQAAFEEGQDDLLRARRLLDRKLDEIDAALEKEKQAYAAKGKRPSRMKH